jgi:hypothetical protein
MSLRIVLQKLFRRRIVLAAALALALVIACVAAGRAAERPGSERDGGRAAPERPFGGTCWAPTNSGATCSPASPTADATR